MIYNADVHNLIESFPQGYTPSTLQTTLIDKIDQAFKSGKKFVICSAPTGTGKSFIAKTLANSSNIPSKDYIELVTSFFAYKQGYENECNQQPSFGSFALTITKALQDQYADLFKDTKILKGKSNYQCVVDEQYPVDIAPCVHIKQ
ncbi:hypothetical protein EBU95_20725, partial [bacterium]|nr:hypothetical protein [bacterium]